ncbi:MAG: hypothetical protein K8F90_09275 [Hyphomicrobiales bacterium]|nr:hypothetical protein [Hyphomicrobiales bacterium]
MGQLQAAHDEISALAKKNPSDAVNPFKLKLLNKVLALGNEVLGARYKPVEGFEQFDSDDVPSTSDVAMVLSQYIEEAERYRSNSITSKGFWQYVINGQPSGIRTGPPSVRSGKK